MNKIFLLILLGFGLGVIIFPICLSIYLLFKRTFERRAIKRMLKKGKFLVTIDTRDYDSKAWQNQKYGNIDINENAQYLSNLDNKVFKRDIPKQIE